MIQNYLAGQLQKCMFSMTRPCRHRPRTVLSFVVCSKGHYLVDGFVVNSKDNAMGKWREFERVFNILLSNPSQFLVRAQSELRKK